MRKRQTACSRNGLWCVLRCASTLLDETLAADDLLLRPYVVSTLFPLVLPSVIPLLPLPAHLRTPASYRRLLITILSLYLAFSLAASVIPILLKPSFYDVLGVPRLAEPADISAGWKAFARRNHPDRQRGPGSDAELSAEIFRIGRVAYDTLADDEHRWAYDRFGPDSTNWWKFCATRREFLKRGLQDTLSFYVSSVLIYAAMAFFGTGAKETSFVRPPPHLTLLHRLN